MGETENWERLDDMKEPRADHACAVVQHFYGKNAKITPPWTTGIMVTGGYRLRGAWTSSVDFLDFRTGMLCKNVVYNNLLAFCWTFDTRITSILFYLF